MPAPPTLAMLAPAPIAIPGPSVLYVATRSVRERRRAGGSPALGPLSGTVHVAGTAAALTGARR